MGENLEEIKQVIKNLNYIEERLILWKSFFEFCKEKHYEIINDFIIDYEDKAKQRTIRIRK